jgi:adenine-specific DNA-methyltransferase
MAQDPRRTALARQLRRQMTPAEAIVWKHVRDRRFGGFKFRRQHPVGPFYADLVCKESKVIVELDGETHLGREGDDEARSRYLRTNGWLVMRFWNTQIYDELETVLEEILRVCEERRRSPGN